LGDNACINVASDRSVSYCPKIVVTGTPVLVTFEFPKKAGIPAVPNILRLTALDVGSAAVGGVVLVLLVGILAQLVGSSLENAWPVIASSRLSARLGAFRPRKRLPLPLTFVSTVIAAALITSLVELDEVTSLSSWFVTASLWLVGFAVVTAGGLLLTLAVVGKSGRKHAEFDFHASSLLVVAGTACISWLTEFDPPVIFGLVFGLTFGLHVARRVQGWTTLVGAGYVFAIGLISWLVFSLLSERGDENGYVAQIASAIAIATISSLPISLLPVRLLEGRKILEWNRLVAFVAFAASAFAFALLATNPGEPIWQRVEDLTSWSIIYGAFILTSVGVWAWLRKLSTHAEAGKTSAAELVTPLAQSD